jgi:hypothetical protein
MADKPLSATCEGMYGKGEEATVNERRNTTWEKSTITEMNT